MPDFTRKVLSEGNETDYPHKGDAVTVEYTGWLYDTERPDNDFKGEQFDSSQRRGPFTTKIGVARVICGWDIGVPQMSLGEKSILTIPADMAYGAHGFPRLIKPNSDLIFEIELKSINGKEA